MAKSITASPLSIPPSMIMTQFILLIAILIPIQMFANWFKGHAPFKTKIKSEKQSSAKVWQETKLICSS